MSLKLFFTIFLTIFLAELGDKTQLATLLFAADKDVNRWAVFAAASLALIAVTALGVLAGGVVARFISEKQLAVLAGLGFMAIGAWILIGGLRSG